MITTVTGRNQITIPAEIARKLDLARGSRLEWNLGRGQGEILIRIAPTRKELLNRLRSIAVKTTRPHEDSARARDEETEQEDNERGKDL